MQKELHASTDAGPNKTKVELVTLKELREESARLEQENSRLKAEHTELLGKNSVLTKQNQLLKTIFKDLMKRDYHLVKKVLTETKKNIDS